MDRSRNLRLAHGFLALVAVLFGIVTLIAGGRVLAGAHPGYVVFLPLLYFNSAMGLAYVAAGVAAWRTPEQGKRAAAAIFVVNLLVLSTIAYLYAAGSAVAIESVRAMTFRTLVWLVLYLGLAWLGRRSALLNPRDAPAPN